MTRRLNQSENKHSPSSTQPFQVGCEDGTVKLFEILEENIQFQRNLSRQKGRIWGIVFLPINVGHSPFIVRRLCQICKYFALNFLN